MCSGHQIYFNSYDNMHFFDPGCIFIELSKHLLSISNMSKIMHNTS